MIGYAIIDSIYHTSKDIPANSLSSSLTPLNHLHFYPYKDQENFLSSKIIQNA